MTKPKTHPLRNLAALLLRMLGVCQIAAFAYYVQVEDYGLAGITLLVAAATINTQPEDI